MKNYLRVRSSFFHHLLLHYQTRATRMPNAQRRAFWAQQQQHAVVRSCRAVVCQFSWVLSKYQMVSKWRGAQRPVSWGRKQAAHLLQRSLVCPPPFVYILALVDADSALRESHQLPFVLFPHCFPTFRSKETERNAPGSRLTPRARGPDRRAPWPVEGFRHNYLPPHSPSRPA